MRICFRESIKRFLVKDLSQMYNKCVSMFETLATLRTFKKLFIAVYQTVAGLVMFGTKAFAANLKYNTFMSNEM